MFNANKSKNGPRKPLTLGRVQGFPQETNLSGKCSSQTGITTMSQQQKDTIILRPAHIACVTVSK